MPKTYDATPTWRGLVPVWRKIVEAAPSMDHLSTTEFWKEVERMADAADAWNEYCEEVAIAAGDPDVVGRSRS